MPSFTLTDAPRDLWTDSFAVDAASLGLDPGASPWSVTKRTLRGGRRHGVDLIEVDNGALAFAIVPTRGMGLWKGRYKADPLGWRSPVVDGPVHPAFVNLAASGGLGWLDGFDELLCRCGLEHNGAPYEEKQVNPDGSERHTVHGLHGRIANLPAHFVAVHVDDKPPHAITIEGHVDEVRLFGPHLRLITRIRTEPGSNRLTVRDEFVNLKDSPGEMQVLYHWNLGPPYLEQGARFVAPARVICPRDATAQEGLGHFDVYAAPAPGFAEQVYFFELLARDGQTVAMLRNQAGNKAVALRFDPAQLPAFSLWKNTGAPADGYVTGLEPATNYPNPKPFEKQRNRVVTLEPGARHLAEITLEVLDSKEDVAAVEAEVGALQRQASPTIHPKPAEPYAS